MIPMADRRSWAKGSSFSSLIVSTCIITHKFFSHRQYKCIIPSKLHKRLIDRERPNERCGSAGATYKQVENNSWPASPLIETQMFDSLQLEMCMYRDNSRLTTYADYHTSPGLVQLIKINVLTGRVCRAHASLRRHVTHVLPRRMHLFPSRGELPRASRNPSCILIVIWCVEEVYAAIVCSFLKGDGGLRSVLSYVGFLEIVAGRAVRAALSTQQVHNQKMPTHDQGLEIKHTALCISRDEARKFEDMASRPL